MKNICKKLALLGIPLLLYLCFFAAFEPNNYFGLRAASGSTQPIARIRAYEAAPGANLILGDSRMAHFDIALADEASGKTWQNLAFGGASLRETIDLANYVLDSGNEVDEMVIGLSFYTLNAKYDTDRMSALQDTLHNPLAYVFNLEYNVNTLTSFTNWLLWARQRAAGQTAQSWAEAQQESETGDWAAADYIGPGGTSYALHAKLAEYPAVIMEKCEGWALNAEMVSALETLAARCQSRGVKLALVFPPMADNVRDEVCVPLGIDRQMADFLPMLEGWKATYGVTLLDYEWTDRPDFDDDRQFYDGFHLDTVYGLPEWTQTLFASVGAT
ncbi:MAG: hypothetical protein LKJ90_04810 [Faecalibacterium sp.]|jgi:hypothetical protein|nr:hypothetical protein [Faecalibacterium sp.]